jgi:hypothetical protein
MRALVICWGSGPVTGPAFIRAAHRVRRRQARASENDGVALAVYQGRVVHVGVGPWVARYQAHTLACSHRDRATTRSGLGVSSIGVFAAEGLFWWPGTCLRSTIARRRRWRPLPVLRSSRW